MSLLGLMGHSASAAYDGSSAIEIANLWAPSIAIVDIGMPYMDGFVIAEGILALRQPRRPYLVAFTTPRRELWPHVNVAHRCTTCSWCDAMAVRLAPDPLNDTLVTSVGS